MWIRNKLLTLIVLAAIGLAPTGVYAETLVDTKLALMIDVSASVDQNEYWLQLGGYVGAFDSASPSSAAVVNAIQGGQYGSIAVSVVLWSGEGQQTALDFGGGSYWYNVYDTESADNLADAISDAFLGWGKRPYSGLTDIAGAIDFGVDLFNLDSGFTSTRNVMDISGDGKQNVRRDGNWYYETLSQSRGRRPGRRHHIKRFAHRQLGKSNDLRLLQRLCHRGFSRRRRLLCNSSQFFQFRHRPAAKAGD